MQNSRKHFLHQTLQLQEEISTICPGTALTKKLAQTQLRSSKGIKTSVSLKALCLHCKTVPSLENKLWGGEREMEFKTKAFKHSY